MIALQLPAAAAECRAAASGSRLAVQNRVEGHGRPCRRGKGRCRSPSRRARRRTKTGRPARRRPARAPARGTCRRACRACRGWSAARSSSTRSPPSIGRLGQAEVEDLRVAAAGDEEVRRLDVAVDDARQRARPRSASAISIASRARSSIGERAARRCDASASRLRELHREERVDRPVSSTSWIVQMFGWLSAEAARASRAESGQRVGIAGQARRDRNFSATKRWSRASSAL